MAWRDLDLVKYRIDGVPLVDLANAFRKSVNMELSELRFLLAQLGVHIPESAGNNPTIYFVVVEDAYEEMKQTHRKEPPAALLLGVSPAVALTEEMARHKFELQVKSHNEKVEL